MEEERRPLDPTRRLLRTFGVTVTNYEERTAALLERAAVTPPPSAEEMSGIVAEALELNAEMTERLREMSDHVLDAQARVLSELQAAVNRQ